MALLTDIVVGVADKPFDLVSLSLPTMSQTALSKDAFHRSLCQNTAGILMMSQQ